MATKSEIQAADYRAEAIARPFAEASKCSPAVSGTGQGQSGLRTEREPPFSRRRAMADGAMKWCDGLEVPYLPVNIVTALFSLGLVALPSEAALPDVSDQDGDRVAIDWPGLAKVLQAERDAAIREREEWRQAWLRSEESGTRLLAERNAALDDADGLRARVVSLVESQLESVADRAATAETAREAQTSTPGEGLRAAPAASGVPSVVREMTAILHSETTDDDETHAAMATLVEAVCPGWALTQAASGGGEGEPDYYVYKNELGMILYTSPKLVNDGWGGCTVERVYKAPPQPRGWLSQDEREIIAGIADDDEYTEEGQNIAKGLLARSSPPEVVLPESWTLWIEQFVGPVVEPFLDDVLSKRDAEWLAALATAGMAVKEVPRG
jgi:hypothetical protein